MKFPKLLEILSSGYNGCKRVLKVSHKPDKSEYSSLAKRVGLGMLSIGLLGILTNLVFSFIPFFG